MDGMGWMISMTPRDNTGFKIMVLQDLHQYVHKAQVYNNIYNSFARRIFTIRSQSAFYNNFYNNHTDTLFPVFLLFLLFTICTGGIR